MALMTEEFAADLQKGDPIVMGGYNSLYLGLFAEYGPKSNTVRFYYVSDWNINQLRSGKTSLKKSYVVNNGRQRVAKVAEQSLGKNMLDKCKEMKYLLQKNGLI